MTLPAWDDAAVLRLTEIIESVWPAAYGEAIRRPMADGAMARALAQQLLAVGIGPATLPQSIQEALNSGDGIYRP